MAGTLNLVYSAVVALVAVAGTAFVAVGTDAVGGDDARWRDAGVAAAVALFVVAMVVATVS